MDEQELLARRFEEERAHLRGVAYRMLGSLAEADDAVQEAWLRLSRTSDAGVNNLTGWLTTVVSRVCLDMLRTREARREDSFDVVPVQSPPSESSAAPPANPADEVVIAESVGLAVLVVLNALSPAERLAFVLHDMFAMPFEEIAPIVGKSPAAARQLASRARRRVRGESPPSAVTGQRRVVDAFVAALRAGDFEGLIAVLDPDFVIRADAVASRTADGTEVRGPENWARGAIQYGQMARVAHPALIDGSVGLVVAPRGKLVRVLTFTFAGDKVATIEVIAEPERLQRCNIQLLPVATPSDEQ